MALKYKENVYRMNGGTVPFCIKDSSIHGFWYPPGSPRANSLQILRDECNYQDFFLILVVYLVPLEKKMYLFKSDAIPPKNQIVKKYV